MALTPYTPAFWNVSREETPIIKLEPVKRIRTSEPMRNVALIHKGKIIKIYAVTNRKALIRIFLAWRKMYGPKFRECERVINFNDKK